MTLFCKLSYNGYIYIEDVDDDIGEDGMHAKLMDIREPLITLRLDLEERLGVDLSEYSFWLQV